jgi:hypothetical protein
MLCQARLGRPDGLREGLLRTVFTAVLRNVRCVEGRDQV